MATISETCSDPKADEVASDEQKGRFIPESVLPRLHLACLHDGPARPDALRWP